MRCYAWPAHCAAGQGVVRAVPPTAVCVLWCWLLSGHTAALLFARVAGGGRYAPSPLLTCPSFSSPADVTGVRATSGESGGRGTVTCRLCDTGAWAGRPGSGGVLCLCSCTCAALLQQGMMPPVLCRPAASPHPLGCPTPSRPGLINIAPLPPLARGRQVCGARGAALRLQVPGVRAGGHEHPLLPGHQVTLWRHSLNWTASDSSMRWHDSSAAKPQLAAAAAASEVCSPSGLAQIVTPMALIAAQPLQEPPSGATDQPTHVVVQPGWQRP